MVITFSNDTAWNQLQEHGFVVTFRKNRRKRPHDVDSTFNTWCNRGRGETKEMNVMVKNLGKAKPVYDLDDYVDVSGFDSVEHWRKAIGELNGESIVSGWLYLVVEL